MRTRWLVFVICGMLGVGGGDWLSLAQAGDTLMPIAVSLVGPRNLSYLPIDLIPRIGADREEQVALQLQHVGGGGLAIKQVLARNSDFAVVGFPAILSLKVKGGELVGVASVSDDTLFVLMVRSSLREEVKRVGDLKGRVIGVHTSSVNAKTVAQQLVELLLRADGVADHEIRIVPVGQNWEERALLLASGKVDAIMAEEPFASIMRAEERVFFVASTVDPAVAERIPGSRFLHAAVATRPDLSAREPEKMRRMVAMLRRSLAWIGSHAPEELVAQLGIDDPRERAGLLQSLRDHPRLFSSDGKFSNRQIADTNRFFHTIHPDTDAIRMEDLIDDRWAGRKD